MKARTSLLVCLALSIPVIWWGALHLSYAAGVVGTGTAGSCTEQALDAALIGGGVITFNCGKSPVVIPVTKEKLIEQPTTLDGGGLVTISGRNMARVFRVTSGATLEAHRLTIAYGAANDSSDTARDGNGGAILNEASSVVLVDVGLTANRADRHGGGIYNKGGTLRLIRITISGSYVGDNGAGLFNEGGTVMLANSTLSGNFAGGSGGGLFNFAGTITLINATLHNNNAGFGGSSILNNQQGTLAAKNSIIASSGAGGGPLATNCGGQIVDGNKNLQFPDKSCGDTIPMADPQLGPLADNGGFVLTHALKPGSVAIDKADNNVCQADPISKLDGRNGARPIGAVCDVGAYELDPKKPGKLVADVCVTPAPVQPGATPRRSVTITPTPRTCQATQPNLPCNCNGFCDPGESYYTCPQDCPFQPVDQPTCPQRGSTCDPKKPNCCPGLSCKASGNFWYCQ
jgi:hypothetical protein